MPPPQPWDGCFWVEGKGGGCTMHHQPQVFQRFLQPEWMAKQSGAWSELSWMLREKPKTVVKWQELGRLGSHRLRRVDYYVVPAENDGSLQSFAGYVVIEGSTGIFWRLFEWCGSPMPDARLHVVGRENVLVIDRDFGGNVPMFMTWAWVWTAQGPMRIEVQKAIQEAIAKVAPGHQGYDTCVDWSDLSTETYSWGPRGYPGKVGVDERVNAWVELKGNRLIVKRVEWRKTFLENPLVRRWP